MSEETRKIKKKRKHRRKKESSVELEEGKNEVVVDESGIVPVTTKLDHWLIQFVRGRLKWSDTTSEQKRTLGYISVLIIYEIVVLALLFAGVGGFGGRLLLIAAAVLPLSCLYTYKRFAVDVWPASVLQSVQKNSGDERQTRQVRGLRFAFCVALLVCWLALVIAFLLREAEVFVGTESNRFFGFLWWLGLFWLHILLYMIEADILHGFVYCLFWLSPNVETRQLPASHLIARAKAILVVLLAIITAIWGMYAAARPPHVVEYDVFLDRLPSEFEGFKMAVLADIHASDMVSQDDVKEVVDVALSVDPDVVLLVGDILDGNIDQIGPSVAELQRCVQVKYGCYFVNGNHLFYHGTTPAAWTDFVAKLGIKPLRNEHVRIVDDESGASFVIAGVDDISAAQRSESPGFASNFTSALAGVDLDNDEIVMLAHQPRHIDEVLQYPIGLSLHAHVHNGQIFPQVVVVGASQPLIHGHYTFDGHRTQAIVSGGSKISLAPMRTFSQNEMVLIRLHPSRG